MTKFKKGDAVYLIFLDGRLSKPRAYIIHDLWGDESYARNASYLIDGTGGEEQHYHTDLMMKVDEANLLPVQLAIVPDGGHWYIARGNNMGWGRAATEYGAIRNMRRAGGKSDSYVVHRVSKWTTVDGMGALTFPRGIEPVEVKRVEKSKQKA